MASIHTYHAHGASCLRKLIWTTGERESYFDEKMASDVIGGVYVPIQAASNRPGGASGRGCGSSSLSPYGDATGSFAIIARRQMIRAYPEWRLRADASNKI